MSLDFDTFGRFQHLDVTKRPHAGHMQLKSKTAVRFTQRSRLVNTYWVLVIECIGVSTTSSPVCANSPPH